MKNTETIEGKTTTEGVIVAHLGDLNPDKHNPRKHTPRNIGLIEDSLGEVGGMRSIVIDEENNIIAGNGTVEAAGNVGITRVRIIEADGDEIVAVRRRGLSDRQKLRAKYFDNRAGELALWDTEVVAGDLEADVALLEGLFYDKELDRMLQTVGDNLPEFEPGSGEENGRLRNGQAVEAEGLPVSQVKLVQLLYSPDQMAAFEEACEVLGVKFGTDNATDTVLAVLMDARRALNGEA